MDPAEEYLLNIVAKVYPELAEGHSCTFGNAFQQIKKLHLHESIVAHCDEQIAINVLKRKIKRKNL